jgi:hypothetical protein
LEVISNQLFLSAKATVDHEARAEGRFQGVVSLAREAGVSHHIWLLDEVIALPA